MSDFEISSWLPGCANETNIEVLSFLVLALVLVLPTVASSPHPRPLQDGTLSAAWSPFHFQKRGWPYLAFPPRLGPAYRVSKGASMLSTLPSADILAKSDVATPFQTEGKAPPWSTPVAELDLEKKLAVQVMYRFEWHHQPRLTSS